MLDRSQVIFRFKAKFQKNKAFRKSLDKSHPSHNDTSLGTQQNFLSGFARNKENAKKVQIPSETSRSTKNTSY